MKRNALITANHKSFTIAAQILAISASNVRNEASSGQSFQMLLYKRPWLR